LSQDLQSVRASTDTLKEKLEAAPTSAIAARLELSSMLAAFDELVVRECEAQIRLQALGDEKKTQVQLLESAQKTLSEHYFSSSAVISSAVGHTVVLLKSHTLILIGSSFGETFCLITLKSGMH
jgi:hypothetical protein